MLTTYANGVQQQISQMEQQVEALNSKISKAYSHMNKHPYYLHAISIHDGNAYSGHYYAFIKDKFNKKWRKFNDIRVSEANEEDVYKEANGGNAFMTAHWVVYIDQELENQLSKIDLYAYKSTEGDVIDQSHMYASKIPGVINV